MDAVALAKAELVRRIGSMTAAEKEQAYHQLMQRMRSEPSIVDYMTDEERDAEYQRLLECMNRDHERERQGLPAIKPSAAEIAAEELKRRRLIARGKIERRRPEVVEPLPAAPLPVVRVHMHSDEPVGVESCSDRMEPLETPHEEIHIDAAGDVDDEHPEPARVVERRRSADSRKSDIDPWWHAPLASAPAREEIDPMSMTSEEFWSQPVWRATNNHARWTLYDQSNGRCPPPPEPDPRPKP